MKLALRACQSKLLTRSDRMAPVTANPAGMITSNGVYGIPVYERLEARGVAVKRVEPGTLKMIAGRKTEVLDGQGIEQRHTFGLLSGSCRPDDQICVLRSSMRQRDMQVRYASQPIPHRQKALMPMNGPRHHVIDDLTGLTGMRVIAAILAGERDPQQLARLRHERCDRPGHASLADGEALLLVAVCVPREHEDGGAADQWPHAQKRQPGGQDVRLAAYALARAQTALGAFSRRLKARLGPAKALTATAHQLAKIVSNMLRYGKADVDRGAAYDEQPYRERVLKNLKPRAKQMGFELVPVHIPSVAD